MQGATLKGPASPIEVYNCNLHVMDMGPGGWSAGHQYDHQRLATGPAGRPHPQSGDCEGAGWDLGPVPIQADPSSSNSFGNATNSSWGRVSCTEKNYQEGPRRHCSSWYCQPHTGRPPWKVSMKRSALGLKRMLDLMSDHFFWAQMAVQVNENVEKCHQCIIFKAKQQKAAMESTVATHPLELVHTENLWLQPGKGKEENALVVTDHFTQYAQGYITQLQMVKVLWDNFIVHYGLQEKIHLNQGRNFESEVITNLCRLTGTRKLRTSWYHCQTNGQCKKRFNSTLINMLGMLPREWKSD